MVGGVTASRKASSNILTIRDEWGAYVVLARSSVTEHGMVSRTRVPRSRSAKSTRGSHAPPGRTGEPCTGGSGTDGWRARSCEVREMRNAVAARTLVRGYLEKATGELIDTETVTISSEEGRWKRAERHLAGGLSYRKSGSKRGGCRKRTEKVTRLLVPTRCQPGEQGPSRGGDLSTHHPDGPGDVPHDLLPQRRGLVERIDEMRDAVNGR